MNILYSSEISLRAAIISAKKITTNPDDYAHNIKIHALNQIELVEKVEGLISGVKSADSLEKAAIAAAIGGIQLAYKAISVGLVEGKFKRRQFVDECEKHLATFIIDNNKEPGDFSNEELAVKLFYQLLKQKGELFIQYSGIEVRESEAHPNVQFFSILPFFKMSQALRQQQIIASKLDEYRQSIFHFLHSGLPLKYYYEKFMKASSFILKVNSVFSSSNYLNYYRAPRFILTALANLIWNLQHPVHIQTGMPLSTLESATLCYHAEMLLNDLLNPRQYIYLEKIDSKSKRVTQCFYQMEQNIKGLRTAFEYEHLHEINLKNVSLHMHSALQIMSNKMLELIYQDEKAAGNMIALIMTLSTVLLQNPLLYHHFSTLTQEPSPPHINATPCTVIDVLMRFIMLTPKARLEFCQQLINTNLEPETQLAYQLRNLHKNFLIPFEKNSIPYLTPKNPGNLNLYHLSASHFLPLALLVTESFTVFKDTRPHLLEPSTQEITMFSESTPPILDLTTTQNDKKQAQLILDSLLNDEPDNYYHWCISMFFKIKSRHHYTIDQLLNWQNQIRQKTSKLDEYADLIQKNRLSLQSAVLKNNLIEFLSSICELFSALNKKFGSIASQMQTNAKIHRDEKRVLHPMLDDLERVLDSVQKSINQVSTIISAPDFEEQERQKSLENNPLMQQFQPMLARTQPMGVGARQMRSRESLRTTDSAPRPLDKENVTHSSYQPIMIYCAQACFGITSIIFGLNIFTSFLAIHITISILSCLISLAITIALGLYQRSHILIIEEEEQFHFSSPQV